MAALRQAAEVAGEVCRPRGIPVRKSCARLLILLRVRVPAVNQEFHVSVVTDMASVCHDGLGGFRLPLTYVC